jgi:hypothetical protein
LDWGGLLAPYYQSIKEKTMKRQETDLEMAYRLSAIPSTRWECRVKMVAGQPYQYGKEESEEIARVCRAIGVKMLEEGGSTVKLVKSRIQG